MSIQEHLNKIRNAIKGSEVRESIAKGIETAYDDASEKDNANMEVKIARGTNPNLNTRLNKMDETDSQNTEKIDSNYNEVTAQLAQMGYNILNDTHLVSNNDWSSVIQNALEKHNHIYIPTGDYDVLETIEVNWNQTIELGNNTILRKPSEAENDDPILWLKGCYSNIVGKGQHNSLLVTEKKSPKGVLLIGNWAMNDTVGLNVLYNSVRNIGIIGKSAGGEQTGEPSYGMYFCAPEITSLACYFNNIENIYFGKFNVGLMMEGYANANIITGLQFWDTGNEKHLDGGAIKLKNTGGKYPLENTISNVFVHYSHNADCLVLDGTVNYNAITNFIAEPFGNLARWINSTSEGTTGNIITGIDNVNRQWEVADGFTEKNNIKRRSATYGGSAFYNNVTAKKKITANSLEVGDVKSLESSFRLIHVTENTSYKMLEVNVDTLDLQKAGQLEFTINILSANGIVIYNTAKVDFTIFSSVSGVLSVKKTGGFSTASMICKPIVDGRKITFSIKVPNNGTNTSGAVAEINYKYFGTIFSSVEEIKEPTIITGTDTYRTHFIQATSSGPTSVRPDFADINSGHMFFDTTINKPIWYNGSSWVTSEGVTV